MFLRPNEKKFESLKNQDGIYEVDSDFGFAIQNAIDSLDSQSELKKIKNIVITKEFYKFVITKEFYKFVITN